MGSQVNITETERCYPANRIFFQEFNPNIMRTMQRSKEEIIKEKLGGAVQVLPKDNLFAVEGKKKEKKEYESPEHPAVREECEKAFREMQEMLNPANQDKSMRIKELMSF